MPFAVCAKCGLRFCYPAGDKSVHLCARTGSAPTWEATRTPETKYFKDDSVEVKKDGAGPAAEEGADIRRGRHRRNPEADFPEGDQGDH